MAYNNDEVLDSRLPRADVLGERRALSHTPRWPGGTALLALAASLFLSIAGCSSSYPEETACGVSDDCPPGLECLSNNICQDPAVLETCGNGVIDDNLEVCDDGNTEDRDACSPDCRSTNPMICGDNVVDPGETCDDGNTVSGDGCSADCLSTEVCGNSIVDLAANENCDDGNANAGDGCSAACRFEYCGNGELDPGEICEDGNAMSGDGCSADCRSQETCGNGIIDAAVGEACDDGTHCADGAPCTDDGECVGIGDELCAPRDDDRCTAICALPTCGDGILDNLEICDDGQQCTDGTPCTDDGMCVGIGDETCATRAGDGCNATCTSDETCGNSVIDPGESCDDGNTTAGDGCSATCQPEYCGNGALDPGEVCDDGNTNPGDGCSATCASDETCGNGALDPGESCDDGNTNPGDGCSAICVSEYCGNGTQDPGEVCDDGNTTSGDGCSATCASDETCGNGVLDPGEGCEDGNTVPGDGCSATCAGEYCGNGTVDPGEACDDGNTQPGDACSADCSFSAPVYLWCVRETDDMVRVLDTSTLTFTDVGPLGVTFSFGELAYDPAAGIMWMIDGRGTRSLHTVDLSTGAASVVGPHAITDLFGLAVDTSTGVLYGSGESPSGLYQMNKLTGAASFIGDPGVGLDGLTYDASRDQIVGLWAGPGDLYAIDRATGAPTFLGGSGFVDNNGLAWDPLLDVYWAIDWSGNLYQFDPNAGYARTTILSGLGAHDGLTFGPPPP